MAVADARTAREMSQRIKRVTPIIHQNFVAQNALLYLADKRNRIKYGGSHIEFEWYIRKDAGDSAAWGGGELSVRSFEEVDPANRAHLPYCWKEETYGVSDRTLEANRNAGGTQKIYDSLKENLIMAQIRMYNSLGPSVWTGGAANEGDGGDEPIGLEKVVGSAYEGSNVVTVDISQSYANITLNTSAIAAYSANKAGWDSIHWAPVAIDLNEVPGGGSYTWATNCLTALGFLADDMEVTADVSGTGKPIKPDLAFMASTEFFAVKNKILAAQATGYQIPLADKDLRFAGFKNIIVDTLTCIKDTNVPDDSGSKPRVFAIDSKNYYIQTTHKKSEGLIVTEFDTDNPLISGAIGVLKANLGYMVSSPAAVGVLTGCE